MMRVSKRITYILAHVVLILLTLFVGSVSCLADQQPISGTPIWQNVPDTSMLQPGYYTTINGEQYWVQTQTVGGQTEPEVEYPVLGSQYGYYWTDTEGHLLFIVVDPATGNTIGAYSEAGAGNTGELTTTKQVTQTIWNFTQVVPPIVMGIDYPAGYGGEGGYITPWYSTTVTSIPTTLNDPYQFFAFWTFNNNPFPVNATLTANGTGIAGSTTLSLQLPASWQGYVEVPLPSSGMQYGQTYDFFPSATASVQSVVGSDGNAYPMLSGSPSPYFYNADANTAIQVAANQGAWNIGPYDNGFYSLVPGFVNYGTFVPTLASNVGELGSTQVATQTTTAESWGLPSATWNGYTYPGKNGSYYWDPAKYSSSITITNPNPFPISITSTTEEVQLWDGNKYSDQYASNYATIPIPIGGNTIPANSSYTYSTTFVGTEQCTSNHNGTTCTDIPYDYGSYGYMYGTTIGGGYTYYTNSDVALVEAYASVPYPTTYVESSSFAGSADSWYVRLISPVYESWNGGEPWASGSITMPVTGYDDYSQIFER